MPFAKACAFGMRNCAAIHVAKTALLPHLRKPTHCRSNTSHNMGQLQLVSSFGRFPREGVSGTTKKYDGGLDYVRKVINEQVQYKTRVFLDMN